MCAQVWDQAASDSVAGQHATSPFPGKGSNIAVFHMLYFPTSQRATKMGTCPENSQELVSATKMYRYFSNGRRNTLLVLQYKNANTEWTVVLPK